MVAQVAFIARHLVGLTLFAIVTFAAGTLILGNRRSRALRWATGLAAWSQLLFLLALLGQLRVAVIVICAIAVTLLAIARGLLGEAKLPTRFAVVALVAAPAFLMALRPPLAFDETLYHLPYVRAAALTGAIGWLPEMRSAVFPQLQEMLCVPLFLLVGDTSTHLVSLVEVLATCALLFSWGKRRGAGWLAAALYAGSPLVVSLATITYVDAAVALFVAAGFFCLDEEERGVASLSLAGFFFGTAAGVKYTGAVFAVCGVAWVAITAVRRLRDASIVAAASVAAAAPTMLWLYVTSANPVFPLLTSVFGPNAWSIPDEKRTFGEHAVRFMTLAWDVTFARGRVNQQPPVTPLLILMLLLVALAAARSTRAKLLLALCASYSLLWTFMPSDSRYLVPLLPLLCAAAAEIVALHRPSLVRVGTVIAIAPGVAYALWVLAVRGLPPATSAARERMLERSVPEYAAVRRAGDANVYVCGGEQLKYYARGTLRGDHYGPFSYDRVLRDAKRTSVIAARLDAIGADHYLVARRVCGVPEFDGSMQLVYEDAAAQLWRVQRSQLAP